MIPGLATDWKLSPDGLTWIVNFREGSKFHDGSPLTAADVAWTWQHEFSKEASSQSNWF
jgi:peptide/nickel transport system substrate-binding protein